MTSKLSSLSIHYSIHMVYYDVMTGCDFLDAAKLPADSLAKVVAYNMDILFQKHPQSVTVQSSTFAIPF